MIYNWEGLKTVLICSIPKISKILEIPASFPILFGDISTRSPWNHKGTTRFFSQQSFS